MSALPHATDLELLGLAVAEDGQSGRFEVRSGLVRHDGALYGGTGLAVSVVAMEAATQRDVLWCSTQFVSQPFLGDRVTWDVERLAVGRRAAQLLVRARANDDTAFVAIGSTGIAAPDGLTGQYVPMPEVSPPDESPAHQMRRADRRGEQEAQRRPVGTGEPGEQLAESPQGMAAEPSAESWAKHIELRQAELRGDPRPSLALWARRRDEGPHTPAVLAFIADMVPVAVARAAGKLGAGSSLDNSMRFHGGDADTGWVLVELHGELANGGFGHGSLRVWTAEGKLVATGSQTAAMRFLFDEGETPNLPPPRPRTPER
jgi:acyl-CoA thioesterase